MNNHRMAVGRQSLADNRPDRSAASRDERALGHHAAALMKMEARPSMRVHAPWLTVK